MKKQTIKKERPIEKDYINLAITEVDGNSMSRVIPTAIVLALVVALFTKFAVLNPMNEVRQAQAYNNQLRTQIAELKSNENKLAELRETYRRYGTAWMNKNEAALTDRMDALDVLEHWLMPSATINSARISGNTMSLNIENVTLEETAVLVQQLKDLPNVSNVTVFTATDTDRTVKTEVAMNIVLQKAEEQKGGQN